MPASTVICALVVSFVAFGWMSAAAAQTTWYVDDDAPGDLAAGDPDISDPLEDGSQSHPFDAIQEGIDAAVSGDTVRVAGGTYAGIGNRNIDFGGRLITVRSENGAATCIIDCEQAGRGFYFHSGETSESLLIGFTITNGAATSTDAGGSLGGGISCSSSSPTIINCIFSDNHAASYGGGLHGWESGMMVVNCVFHDNNTDVSGGGMYTGMYSSGRNPTLVNCTFADNAAVHAGGGIHADYNSQVTVANTILWDNLPSALGFGGASGATITYSIVEGGFPGESNMDADPLLADPDNDDYRLLPGSPCIGAGLNEAVLADMHDLDDDGDIAEPIPFDLDGWPRILNGTVDIGAYEFIVCPTTSQGSDCNSNGLLDACDIRGGSSADCNGNRSPDECDLAARISFDCNSNQIPDSCDVAFGSSHDANQNTIPDECEFLDCNSNGVHDADDLIGGTSRDCNGNYLPDDCDIGLGVSLDCNGSDVPDECELNENDCNGSAVPDECEIAAGTSADCNVNSTPDECESTEDCNTNGVLDICDIAAASSADCNLNDTPDECEWADCNTNGNLDECDVIASTSSDCDENGVPDECGGDCNENGIWDACDIAFGTSEDLNQDGRPDECATLWIGHSLVFQRPDYADWMQPQNQDRITDSMWITRAATQPLFNARVEDAWGPFSPADTEWASGLAANWRSLEFRPFVDWIVGCPPCVVGQDAVLHQISEDLYIDIRLTSWSCCGAGGFSYVRAVGDCNSNGIPDGEEIADGTSSDCNGNYVPDECEPYRDCNSNGVQDVCDLVGTTSLDCNGNDLLDECEPDDDCNSNTIQDICDIAGATSIDFNENGVPDECEPHRSIHVDDDALGDPGPGDVEISDPQEDGSLEHPFDSIQEGIHATLSGDAVLVADGTYTGEGNRDLDFGGRLITLRSVNGWEKCIIDCQKVSGHRGFSFQSGETANALVSGFTVRNCGQACRGAGMYISNSSPTVNGCSFEGNFTEDDWFYGACYGGGIYTALGDPAITNCRFVGNGANHGGGMYVDSGSPTLTNCAFVGNWVYWDTGSGGVGGGAYGGSSRIRIANCILWANAYGQIDVWGNLSVTYSTVQDGWPGEGNIDAAPRFVRDPDDGGDGWGDHPYTPTVDEGANDDYGSLRLLPGSPCVDAGDNAALPAAMTTDLDGNPRFEDVPCVPDTGSPAVGEALVDMGPHELLNEDCNTNEVSDVCDIRGASSYDCNSNGVPDECEPDEDCNTNGVQDVCDIAGGTSDDCNWNSVPDACEVRFGTSDDCNANGNPDSCDVASGSSPDCNANEVPDECDLAAGTSADCNLNGIPDDCLDREIDCNGNAVPDDCDLDGGTAADCNINRIPDACEPDCNSNDVADECDLTVGTSPDVDENGIPDECQRVIHVDDDAPGDPGPDDPTVSDPVEDGSAEHPYDAIQEAIDASANADIVLVADGTYRGFGNRDLDFGGRIISVMSEKGAAACVIDCGGEATPHRAFYFGNQETPEASIRGLTITHCGADADSPGGGKGGGVLVEDSSPTISHCVFRQNYAEDGGGMASNWWDTEPTVVGCAFIDNTAQADGGGIHSRGSRLNIMDCVFTTNTAEDGGGMYQGYGSEGRISACVFRGNSVTRYGGGMVMETDLLVVNCMFSGNSSPYWGGGIYTRTYGRATVINCTFIANSGGTGGGVNAYYTSSPTLINCILWGNTASSGSQISGPVTVNYSIVQGGWAGSGNLNANPWLVRAPHDGGDGWSDNPGTEHVDESANNDYGDLHLLAGSPAIDAGNSGAVPPEISADLDGWPRFSDDPQTPDTGVGPPPIVDMGAYEIDGDDCNHNDISDVLEIAAGSSADCNDNGTPDECEPDEDCNYNGVLDECDLAAGTSDDCQGNTMPDECELDGNDCNADSVPDDCQVPGHDCNANGSLDECEIAAGTSSDCNSTDVPDQCELAANDCNASAIPDECELAGNDCNGNNLPDDCEDCNENHAADECDIIAGTSADELPSFGDGVPDECQFDCNNNAIPDTTDIMGGTSQDCDGNATPDDCDIAVGSAQDCDEDAVPDSCQLQGNDCNANDSLDVCDIAAGVSLDCDINGIPDECAGHGVCLPPSTANCPHADVDCSNEVNGLDIAYIASSSNFGRAVCECAHRRTDVNGDRVVNGLDIAAASSSACFGQ